VTTGAPEIGAQECSLRVWVSAHACSVVLCVQAADGARMQGVEGGEEGGGGGVRDSVCELRCDRVSVKSEKLALNCPFFNRSMKPKSHQQ
jgi:hypothetical protein